MNVSAVLRELMAAGIQGEALIAAVERIELADDAEKRSTRAARNRRYQDRLKARKAEIEEAPAEPAEPAPADPDKTDKTSQTSYPSYDGSPEKKVSPDPSKNPTPSTIGERASRPRSEQGRRMPPDFRLSLDDRQFARAAGWTERQVADGEAEFIDYWTNEAGAKARKLDWSKTWRNRVRRYPPPRGPSSQPQRWQPTTGRDSAATALLRRDRMERNADGFDPFDDPSADRRPIAGDRRPRDPPPQPGRMGGSGEILDLEPIRPERE